MSQKLQTNKRRKEYDLLNPHHSAKSLEDEIGALRDPEPERARHQVGRSAGGWSEVDPGKRSEVQVPDALIRDRSLPPEAKYLYVVLLSRCGAGARRWSGPQRELLRHAGFGSVNTLRGHTKRLVDSGWLRLVRKRGRYHSVYELLNPHESAREAQLERAKKRLEREAFKGEALMKEWLNLLVDMNEFEDNARPGFLVNPASGERLEYDRWYPAGVALEFNGSQHYAPTDAYPDPERARDQRLRDLVKSGLSAEQGITMVVVHPEDLTLERIRTKVNGLLPLRHVPADDPIVRYLATVSRRYMQRALRPLSREALRAQARSDGRAGATPL